MAFNISGALRGLGEGASEVGNRMAISLEKKKERDFQSQQSAIAAERAQALAARRERHDITMQGMRQEFQTSERLGTQAYASTEAERAREFRSEEAATGREFTTQEREAAQEFKKNLSEDQQKALFAQEEKLLKMRLDAQKDLETFKMTGKAGAARTPKEAEWTTARQIADNLLMEEKITVEQYANTVKEAAYGLLEDPRGRETVPSGGMYEKSDIAGLMKLSPKERAQELQGIRDREGEEVFRQALNDLREYSIEMSQKTKDPTLLQNIQSVLGQGARSALAFGQRNVEGGYQKPTSELNAREQYERLQRQLYPEGTQAKPLF